MQTPIPRDRSTEHSYTWRVPYVNAATVASVQTVFSRMRLSHQGWETRQLEGRIDPRSAWRYDAKGQVDIFRERRLPSPTKLDVHLLLDASGSMSGHRACRSQDMAATLVEAFKRIPTVRIHVWQHNAIGGVASIYRIYEPGMNPEGLNRISANCDGGNADGFALEAVGQRVASQMRPDTLSLVIMISDGLPSVEGNGATGEIKDHSVLVTQNLRRKGVGVMAVAIAGDKRAHEYMYGKDATVLFTGDWNALSRDFAATFGKVLRTNKVR